MNRVNIDSYSRADFNISGKVYFTILFSSIFWILMIFTAPFLADSSGIAGKLSDFIYLFFSRVCHQDNARSFHIFDNKLGVCSRCLLMYLGFLAGTVAYPLKYRLNNTESPSLIFLFSASTLLFLDVVFDLTGIMQNTFLSRSVTGLIIGFILPFYLIPGFTKFFYELNSFFRKKISYKN